MVIKMPPMLYHANAYEPYFMIEQTLRTEYDLRFQGERNYKHDLEELFVVPEGSGGEILSVHTEESENVQRMLFVFEDRGTRGYVLFTRGLGNKYLRTEVYARSIDDLRGLEAQVTKFWPPQDDDEPSEDEDPTIEMSFWHHGGAHGMIATEHKRDLVIPEWNAIKDNYAPDVQEMYNYLTSEQFVAGEKGRMILWHGPPGTGKTYAIRSLMNDWRKWTKPEYITDPEVFFGHSAHYMMNVLLKPTIKVQWDEGRRKAVPTEDWRIIILEDAGEMLSIDARERAGQGLSRLLNAVDGMIGQGLKVLFLMTTNEPLKKMHPAIARPGRTAVECEFGPLSEMQCADWMEKHGMQPEIDKSYTLAELYAKKHGGQIVHQEKEEAFGFGG